MELTQPLLLRVLLPCVFAAASCDECFARRKHLENSTGFYVLFFKIKWLK
jgi:hypothetical protein